MNIDAVLKATFKTKTQKSFSFQPKNAMKYFFMLWIGISCVLYASGQNQSSQDSLQILSIIDDWNKAWQTKDYLLAAKGYSQDARFTNAFGDKCNGQAEVESLLKEVFSLPFVMAGQSETAEHHYQVLNGTTVIVHTAVVRKGQQMPMAQSSMTGKQRICGYFKKAEANGRLWHI